MQYMLTSVAGEHSWYTDKWHITVHFPT